MKTKILLAFFAVALIGIVIFSKSRNAEKIQSEADAQDSVISSQSLIPDASRSNDHNQQNQGNDTSSLGPQGGLSYVPSNGLELANGSTQQAVVVWSNAVQQMSEQINRPIEFFGKVIDENGSAVIGANVELSVVIFPELHFGTNIISDEKGLFSLNGISGAALTVLVTRDGYEEVEGANQNRFIYYSHRGSTVLRPDAMNPAIFRIQKKKPAGN